MSTFLQSRWLSLLTIWNLHLSPTLLTRSPFSCGDVQMSGELTKTEYNELLSDGTLFLILLTWGRGV